MVTNAEFSLKFETLVRKFEESEKDLNSKMELFRINFLFLELQDGLFEVAVDSLKASIEALSYQQTVSVSWLQMKTD